MTAVDTNILLYVYDRRDPIKQDEAVKLVASLSDGVLLWQVAVEFIAASRKLDRTPEGVSHSWQRLDEFRRGMQLVLPKASVLDEARRLTETSQLQFWDALIHAACIEAGITRLYSEDIPGSASGVLEVVNPFA